MTPSGLPTEIYNTIQEIFRKTPVLLVGSGFSCGYGLPHMGALGAHLVSTVGPSLTTIEAKTLWASSLSAITASLESGLNTIASGLKGREEIISVLRRETARLILEKTLKAEADILSAPNPSSLAPARLLKALFDGAPQNAEAIYVITTNYDTLIELFCDLAGLPLDTGFSGFRRRVPRPKALFTTQYTRVRVADKKTPLEHRPCLTVRLHKPHGSITWLSTKDGPIEVLNDSSDSDKAIVVPGPSKYHDALVNTLFDMMRTEMNSVFSKASALICLGFGFNDDHLQGVIKTRLTEHMPVMIITKGLTDNIQEVIRDYPHVIVFCDDGSGGSYCYHNHQKLASTRPLWQLDDFLKEFIE